MSEPPLSASTVPKMASLPHQAASSPPCDPASSVSVKPAAPSAVPPRHLSAQPDPDEDEIDWENERYKERRSFQARRRRKENVALQAAHELTMILNCNVYMVIERRDDTRAPRKVYHALKDKRWPPTFEDMWEHDYPEPLVFTPESMGSVKVKTRDDRRAPPRLKNGTIAPRQCVVPEAVPSDVREGCGLVRDTEAAAQPQSLLKSPVILTGGRKDLGFNLRPGTAAPTTPVAKRQQQEEEPTSLPSPTLTPTGPVMPKDQQQPMGFSVPSLPSRETAGYDTRRFCLADVKMKERTARQDDVLHGRVQSVKSRGAGSQRYKRRGRGRRYAATEDNSS